MQSSDDDEIRINRARLIKHSDVVQKRMRNPVYLFWRHVYKLRDFLHLD